MSRLKILLIVLLFVLFAPSFGVAEICPADPSGSNPELLCNPTRAGSIEIFIGNTFTVIAAILGVVTISMIVYSGFRMVISQGNEEALTQAKSSFKWSLIGFILTVSAFMIVFAIGGIFQDNLPDRNEITGVTSPIKSSDAITLTTRLLQQALSVVGILAILFIIINGFRYITAGGNDELVTKAKAGLLWAMIGLVITVLAYVIVTALNQLISG